MSAVRSSPCPTPKLTRQLAAHGHRSEAEPQLCFCRRRIREAPCLPLCLHSLSSSLAESIPSFPGHLHCHTQGNICVPVPKLG